MINSKMRIIASDNNVGFGKRFLAFLLDVLIINLLIVYPFRGAFMEYFNEISRQSLMQGISSNITMPLSLYWVTFIISILALLYFTFFDYYLGQTPGKMLLKIKVISTIDKNEGISLPRAILRNCYILPFFPFYIFWFVEPVYLAFYKERFLEKITGTRTVYEFEKNHAKKYIDEYKLSKV